MHLVRSNKWYHTLYLGMFGIALTNAFILARHTKPHLSHENLMLTAHCHYLAGISAADNYDSDATQQFEDHDSAATQHYDPGVSADSDFDGQSGSEIDALAVLSVSRVYVLLFIFHVFI